MESIMHVWKKLVLIVFFGILMSGASRCNDKDTGNTMCNPGENRSCNCSDNAWGIQYCSGGNEWGLCNCQSNLKGPEKTVNI